MDTTLLSIIIFRYQINKLRRSEDDDRIDQQGGPILPELIRSEPPPTEPEQQEYQCHDNKELPAQAYHHDLQRDHQQDRIEIIENSQHLDLAIHPALFEVARRQHRKEDTGRSRGCKTAEQQILFPCPAIVPIDGRQQHEHIVESYQQPGNGRRGHGDKIVLGIGFPTRLIDLELPSDIDHDKRQTDIEESGRSGLKGRIAIAQHSGQHLGGDKPQDKQ